MKPVPKTKPSPTQHRKQATLPRTKKDAHISALMQMHIDTLIQMIVDLKKAEATTGAFPSTMIAQLQSAVDWLKMGAPK